MSLITKVRIALVATLCALSLAALPPSLADASPGGPRTPAPSCSQAWSPFRTINAKSSKHYLFFTVRNNGVGQRFQLKQNQKTCEPAANQGSIWVDWRCTNTLYGYNYGKKKYERKLAFNRHGWNNVPWYYPPSLLQKWVIRCPKGW